MSLLKKKQKAFARPRGSRRKYILIATCGAGIGLFVLLFVLIHQLPENPPVQKPSAPPTYQGQSNEKQFTERPLDPLKEFKAKLNRSAAKQSPDKPKKVAPRAYQSGYKNVTQAEKALPYAQGLIAGLYDVNLETWTPETLPEINRILQALVAQGEEALPAIRQLLESGNDFRFMEVMDAADFPDYGSIRLGLFDVLRQIGGPEAESILLGELQTTYEPSEINTLTKSLEELAPGEYLDVAVAAARDTLDTAAKGQLPPEDVSLLFQVLQTHGDATVVADLEDQREQWGFYAAVALAGLPEKEGIPSLVDMVNQRLEPITHDKPVQSTDIYADKSLFALQLLAQTAIQDPAAHATLTEQTGSNRIPDSLWPKIGLALAGQYQFQNEKPEDNELLQMVSDPATRDISYPHVIAENGQILYIKNRYGTEKLPPEEIDARLKLIDELLSVSPGREADTALNHARSLLMKNKTKS
jgi:hypothetical protein